MVAAALLLTRNQFRQNLFVKFNHFRGFASEYGDTRTNTASIGYQPVADFYSGKSVLVTGVTGYCGKVLLEKLLYTCTGLDKVYLLVRDKDGTNVNARLEKMFANPLFSRIKERYPDSLNKVVPVSGDMGLPQLGINTKDEQILIDKVSVVFHAAATIMFNEPLSVPMKINFEGTRKVLNLCKRMKNMEGFVCLSTAYAHTQRPILSEKIYPAPAKVEDVYKFIEKYGNNKKESQKFIRGRDNAYCFVKALMEAYVADNHGNVPTCIIRPSIVTPTLNEPIKGWLDNWNGATGVLHNVAKGWDHISLGDKNHVIDLTPVDHVANLSIVAGARINGSKDVQVYNSTTSAENPIRWADANKYIIKESVNNGYNEVPFPFVVHSKSKSVVDIITILQMIPAYFADIWLRITGKEPKYANVVSQAIKLRKAYKYFICNSWIMEADRTVELFSKMSAEDQKRFPCNPADIYWPEYLKDYCNGIHRYMKPRFTVKRE